LTLHQLFEKQADLTPDRVAVRARGTEFTYRVIEEKANRLARTLKIEPGSPVGVCLHRDLHLLPALLSVMKAGGAYVPLDPHYPVERLKHMLDDSGANVITSNEIARQLPLLGQDRKLFLIDEVDELASGERLDLDCAEDSLAYIMYTSGSTGRPKGVMGTHLGMVNRFHWMWREFPFGQDEVCCAKTSLNFVDSVWELFGPLLAGVPVTLIPDEEVKDALSLANLISREKISRLVAVPSLLTVLLDAWEGQKLHPILITSSGEALTSNLARRLLDVPGVRLLNLYGSSEIAADATYIEITKELLDEPFVPIGKPIDNMTCLLLADGQPAASGVPGELYVAGPGVASGYFGRLDLTKERFLEMNGGVYFKTGDMVRWLPDGNMSFIGRADFQVKIRGNRVEPGDVETVIRTFPGMQNCVVTARTIGDTAQLVAYCVCQGKLDKAGLRDYLSQKLPDYMVCSHYMQLDALPLNPNGKLDRGALPDPVVVSENFVAAESEKEKTLALIWEEVLNLPKVGVEDCFFELGGDSVSSLRMVMKARKAGIPISPAQLQDHSTIAALSALEEVIEAEQGLVEGDAPLTPMQRYYFWWANHNPNQFNNAVLFVVSEPLNADVLKAAFRKVVEHHDSLRLRFSCQGGNWSQAFSFDDDVFELPLRRVNLPSAGHNDQMRDVCEELQAQLNVQQGPMIQAALFEGHPDGRQRLLLAMNHLTHDGTSMQYLFEDLELAYRQLTEGQDVELPPKSSSFQAWSRALQAWAQEERSAEWKHWMSIPGQAPSFPTDFPAQTAKQKHIELHAFEALSKDELTRFKESVGRGYQKALIDVQLTALGLMAQKRSGQNELLLHQVGHGREPCVKGVDVSRTTGWLVTHTPFHLRLPAGEDPLQSVTSQLKAVPNNGIGHGAMRWLSGDSRAEHLAAHDKVRTLFNYEGDLWETSYYGDLFLRPEDELMVLPGANDPENEADYWFYVVALIVRGTLLVEFFYSTEHYRRESMESLAQTYRELVSGLCGTGRVTFEPSALGSEGPIHE
jgi:amino acid adenylation domain-containing protein/non-ribosomal peptide synthase protein (TIGR01720 family)